MSTFYCKTFTLKSTALKISCCFKSHMTVGGGSERRARSVSFHVARIYIKSSGFFHCPDVLRAVQLYQPLTRWDTSFPPACFFFIHSATVNSLCSYWRSLLSAVIFISTYISACLVLYPCRAGRSAGNTQGSTSDFLSNSKKKKLGNLLLLLVNV